MGLATAKGSCSAYSSAGACIAIHPSHATIAGRCRAKAPRQAAADALQLEGKDLEQLSLGFGDETAARLYGNAARLWSFDRKVLKPVNTDKKKCKSFGFYALKGNSMICHLEKGNEQSMFPIYFPRSYVLVYS